MTTKSMSYDHPAYIARQILPLGVNAAGSGGVTSKFTVFAAMQVFSITAAQTVAGTSTYTLWNGTATVTGIAAQSFSLIRIFSTATGGVPALGTSTFGPFVNSVYNGTSTGTQTNAIGAACNVALYSGTATATGQVQAGSNAAVGGFAVNQGDILYVVNGTDTSGVASYALEVAVQQLANVTA
jgi:hypothetical protein